MTKPKLTKVKNYPDGVYIIKGEELSPHQSEGISLQTCGCGCYLHKVVGDFYKISTTGNAQKYMIFNRDFWYVHSTFSDNTFLPIPMEILKTIDYSEDDTCPFEIHHKWVKDTYDIDLNKREFGFGVNWFEKYRSLHKQLQEAAIKDILPMSTYNTWIIAAIKSICGLDIEVLDEKIEEAFVHINVLSGELAGPAILTWDNCD